jgi:hypothetical protein
MPTLIPKMHVLSSTILSSSSVGAALRRPDVAGRSHMSTYTFVPDVLRGLSQLDARELVRRARRVEELETLLRGGPGHGA